MKTQPEIQSAEAADPTSNAAVMVRRTYVPPKLELLDTGETRLNLNPPFNGSDGVFYS